MKEKLVLKQWLVKVPLDILGLFLCASGIVLAIQSNLGPSPWDVLQVGLSIQLPISIGQASQLVSIVMLLFTWYKGIIPGIGTLAEAFFIGFFIDLIYKYIPICTPEETLFRIIMLVAGISMLAFGIVTSLKAGLGVGSRDQLMEYLIGKTGRPVEKVRPIMELTALVIGALLKGPIGIGSIFVATFIGYLIRFSAKILNYNFDAYNHYTLLDMWNNSNFSKEKSIANKHI
ncbi:membrane protein [Clostridium sp. VAP41]|uniref:YczE/YyaS/YitT family protein n=1 Tax=Clostridium sp. VAP41 TaxID=2949979 RepID=UPI00207993BE|nr:membrane protein [Clostridium sp. VAP41]